MESKSQQVKAQLVFAGMCEEAFTTYAKVLKGEIAFLFRKKEDPTFQGNKEEGNQISHAILKTPFFELGGQDADHGESVETGNNNKLVLVFYNLDEIHKVFNSLAEGGKVVTPLEKTFFSEAIGEVVDKFGIRWLIMMTDEGYSAE